MVGGRWASFRGGDRAEKLAEYLLKFVAYVSPVPREEDIGHDFLCTLSHPDGKLLTAGPFFTVQAKSNYDAIAYESDYAVRWIVGQENPFFVGVVDQKTQELELYSTWHRLNAFLLRAPNEVRLIPGTPPPGRGLIDMGQDSVHHTIYLGAPAVRISAASVDDAEYLPQIEKTLRAWIRIDRENILRRDRKMYWTRGPSEYKTNMVPVPSDGVWYSFFDNPKNIGHSVDNLILSCIAYAVDLVQVGQIGELTDGARRQQEAVYGVLAEHKEYINDFLKQVLRDRAGFDVDSA